MQRLHSLQRELITAAVLWTMVAGVCVVVANVWAMGV